MTFVPASQFHAYLPWVSVLKIHKCESVSSRFQQGAQSRGPLCDCETLNFKKVRFQLYSAVSTWAGGGWWRLVFTTSYISPPPEHLTSRNLPAQETGRVNHGPTLTTI